MEMNRCWAVVKQVPINRVMATSFTKFYTPKNIVKDMLTYDEAIALEKLINFSLESGDSDG